MKKLIIIYIGALIVPASVSAQHQNPEKLKATSGYISVGYNQINHTQAVQSLNKGVLPGEHDKKFSLGFGGGVFFNRWYFGGRGKVLTGQPARNNMYSTYISSGLGLVSTGYLIKRNSKYIVYPSAGIGGGGSEIRTESVNDQDFKAQSGFLVTNLAFNAEFFPDLKAGKGGFMVGVSLEYNIVLAESEWQSKNEAETPGEIRFFNTTGPSVRIKLGWGVNGF